VTIGAAPALRGRGGQRSVAALHVAAEPDAADRLASRWARLPLAVPLPETVTILTVRW
jgi:hypothetical protein